MRKKDEYRQLVRSITSISFPVLVEQFFVVLMGVVSTILVANIGKEAVAAIGMIDMLNNIMIALFGALSIGGTVLVAQYTGQRRPDLAGQAAGQALASNSVIASLITFLLAIFNHRIVLLLYAEAEPLVRQYATDYLSVVVWSYIPLAITSIAFGILRGAGDTKTPMLLSVVMNVINILLSYFLIYGISWRIGRLTLEVPGFGIFGAAWGITLARTIGMGLVLLAFAGGKSCIQLTVRSLIRPVPHLLRRIFSLGIPASAEQLMFQGGRLLTQTFVVSLGTAAIAGNTIALSINAISIVPGNALAIAATTLVGQLIGAEQPYEARKQLNVLTVLGALTLALTSIILGLTMAPLIGFYTSEPEVAQVVRTITISFLFVQPLFWAPSFLTPAGLRGAGDIRFTLIISMASMWLIRILMGYIFAITLGWGAIGVWVGMYTDWLIRSVFFVRRVQRDDWFQKVIL